MSEFYQDGIITNFHNLTRRNPDELEYELQVFSGQNSMGLILPSLFSELEGPALTHIIDELSQVNYLTEIVIIALHDCDIVTYSREMLTRLLYSVANPNFHYDFCKGYYARVANQKLNGRVGRLLVFPLLKSLQKVYGNSDYLDYMRSFRYPLSGEFAMRTHVLNNLRIPSDWGLEIGVLSEIYRGTATSRICQVDIADNYDHKHQPMSEDNPDAGLQRMAMDITKALYRKLAIQGPTLSACCVQPNYRTALDMIDAFEHDAKMNGLAFDRHGEELAVELFSDVITASGHVYSESPGDKPFVPSWNRVQSAFPDILERLYQAGEADNAIA
ncbi:glycosyl transferase [Symbiopectobacterium sp.]|uniref:glycosyl transferase n=1 Tax=Symbiopectobacterium sp. TaxID=2952789 RepID=UPI003F2ABCEC